MRWVDVRIPSADCGRAFEAVGELRPHELQLDPSPPAAGPEAEICAAGVTEQAVREQLERRGISVLAIRSRLGSVRVRERDG